VKISLMPAAPEGCPPADFFSLFILFAFSNIGV
jgi:hypothetical protein